MKKFILSLFVGLFGIISFCSAYDQTFTWQCGSTCFLDHRYNFSAGLDFSSVLQVGTDYYLSCDVEFSSFTWSTDNCIDGDSGNGNPINIVNSFDYFPPQCNPKINFNFSFVETPTAWSNITCTLTDTSPSGDSCDYSGYVLLSEYNNLLNQYNSLNSVYSQCKTSEYNYYTQLNSCQSDLNSCQSNTSGFNDQLNNCNLSLNACNSSLTNCLQYNCPEVDYTGDLLRSNIYINNILHPGRQFINIDIPDYIQWDYSVGDDDFNLYVGSGYDVDYIESVIDINSYRPTSEDFTGVFVGGLTLIFPYIFVALLIIFIRKLVKRIFK